MQPVSAAQYGVPPQEVVDHGAPGRVGQGRKAHAAQTPTVDSRFIGLLRMKCPQRAHGAFTQCQPVRLEKDKTFTRRLNDPRLRRQRNLLRGTAAKPDQLAHLDTLPCVAEQWLNSLAGKETLDRIQKSEPLGTAAPPPRHPMTDDHPAPEGVQILRIPPT